MEWYPAECVCQVRGNHAAGTNASAFSFASRRVLAHWYGPCPQPSYPARCTLRSPDHRRQPRESPVTTAVEIEQEAATERAPTKPPKLNSAAFKAVPEIARTARRGARRGRGVLQDGRQVEAADARNRRARWRGGAEVARPGRAVPRLHDGLLTNEFWREQVAAIPFNRRLLLLPHCLKNAEGCPADYDEFGLDCRKCGACSVADFKTKAEDLGYKVLVSEGTPIVLKIIVTGHVDAIVGVACLNVLEKAFDKILLAGIPCVAAPLLSSNCRSTSVDDDWVSELIDLHTAAAGDEDEDLRPPDAGGPRDCSRSRS